ncbi:MAG: hypothetical protein NC406_05855 [Bacteroides sp.]|nr:hypothetical protein [Bacteroides sp.]MCM1095755.1 hypothetical protein [Terasakiella sp.]
MKRIVLLAAMAASIGAAAQDDAAGKIYIVPVDDAGRPVELADGSYQGQVELTDADESTGMTARGFKVDGPGFAFYAKSSTDSKATFYMMPPWATLPAIIGMENPLAITGNKYVPVPQGEYDVVYYNNTRGYNYFRVTMSDDPDRVVYPSQIFMMSADGKYATLVGTDGVYDGLVAMPASFRVSYEQRYDMPEFIYGPDGDGRITATERMPLKLRSNTDTNLTLTADSGVQPGEKVLVRVSIVPGDSYIFVADATLTGIGEAEADSAEPRYYDLGGRPLQGAPDAHGVYIMRRGSHTSKVVI